MPETSIPDLRTRSQMTLQAQQSKWPGETATDHHKARVTTVKGKILTKRQIKVTYTRIERRKSSRLASAGCSPRPQSDRKFQLACFGLVTSRCWTEGSQACESPQLRHRHLASNADKTHHPNLKLQNNKALIHQTTKFALGLRARPDSLPDSRACLRPACMAMAQITRCTATTNDTSNAEITFLLAPRLINPTPGM